MDYQARLTRIRQSMAQRGLDAMLVSRPENRRYLCGYSVPDHGIAESSGVLLICRREEPRLLTDFRFQEQAEEETRGWQVALYPKGLLALLDKLLPDLGIARLGFESDYTLHSTAAKLSALGQRRNIEMVGLRGVVEAMRLHKSEEEIARLRRAVRLGEEVFRSVSERFRDYGSEVEAALAIAAEMRRRGAEGESFPAIVASGAASSKPHALPQNQAIAGSGPVVVDMGLVLDGYCSDMTRSFCLGEPDARYREVHRTVRRAQLAAIAAVRDGVTGREVDAAARAVIEEAGYGKAFGHATGHGVGLAVHEEPRVSPKSRKKLRAGMVITIEPGIYLPGWGGIRLEDMVVVRRDGCENLNRDTTWLDI